MKVGILLPVSFIKKSGKYPNFYKNNKFRRNCDRCNGKGQIPQYNFNSNFYPEPYVRCPICGGRGKLGS